MTTLSKEIFGTFNKDDGRVRSMWEIENLLPAMPVFGTTIGAKNGHWFVGDCLHTSNTYGELLFWEWLAEYGLDYDRFCISGSRIGFHVPNPNISEPWEYTSYRDHMNSKCKHGNYLGGAPWMSKYSFFNTFAAKKIEDTWIVPVRVESIAEGLSTHQLELGTSSRLKKVGWALWRITREFNGRVGFFDGSFVCEDETDAVVLAPYCEMLGVLRQKEPEKTGWFEDC